MCPMVFTRKDTNEPSTTSLSVQTARLNAWRKAVDGNPPGCSVLTQTAWRWP
jgi:hypothetical protein